MSKPVRYTSKANVGTAQSVQSVTFARTELDSAFTTENSVVRPFGSSRSSSKYGTSKVAAGTTSRSHRPALAGRHRSIPTAKALSTRSVLVTGVVLRRFLAATEDCTR